MAAAQAAAKALTELSVARESVEVIFATGASQVETLRALTRIGQIPWARGTAFASFHMDDYIGLPVDHPASFSAYLREKLTRLVPMKQFLEIDGNAPNPEQTCRDYAKALRAADPQLCLLGIGENGHLAFNDPEEANFNDPEDVKIVHLDQVCREQQAAEGWFKTSAGNSGSRYYAHHAGFVQGAKADHFRVWKTESSCHAAHPAGSYLNGMSIHDSSHSSRRNRLPRRRCCRRTSVRTGFGVRLRTS